MLSYSVLCYFLQFFTNPAHEKLLPDLLPPPYQRPYTLILEMNDILVHSEYDVRCHTHLIYLSSFFFLVCTEELWLEIPEKAWLG